MILRPLFPTTLPKWKKEREQNKDGSDTLRTSRPAGDMILDSLLGCCDVSRVYLILVFFYLLSTKIRGYPSLILSFKYCVLQGTVVLLFQPAEEAGNGAKRMIGDGALRNVQAIFAVHVSHELPTAIIGSRPGPLLAGCGFFRAVITGKKAQAGSPHRSVDPVLAASAAVISLQGIVSREANPLDSQVRFFFFFFFFFFFLLFSFFFLGFVCFLFRDFFNTELSIRWPYDFCFCTQVVSVTWFNGGSNLDVIPDTVVIGGTFRAFSNSSFYQLLQRIEEVISPFTFKPHRSIYQLQTHLTCFLKD